jgi:hypothetical protein
VGVLMHAGRLLVAAMAPVSTMAEYVEERTREQEQERPRAEQVGAVFSEKKESGDRDEAGERPPGSGSSAGVAHREALRR